MQFNWVPVVVRNLGALVDGQAGPCMGWCMDGSCVGGFNPQTKSFPTVTYIDRVWLKHHLLKIFQVIIPFENGQE